jgi:predicted amidohydrolase
MTAPEFVAACVQFDVVRGDVAANLAAAEQHLRAAAEAGARLAVLPEMWTTSFLPEPTEALARAGADAEARIAELSAELGIVVVGGGLEAADGRFYNHAPVWDRGRRLANYRKIHLFTVNAEPKRLSPGAEPCVVDTSVGRLGVAICYDIRFPELMRWHFHSGAELLVIPAQWPEARAGHWRALLVARAIENQAFVLGCNRIGSEPSMRTDDTLQFPGDSRILDPMGEQLAAGTGAEGPVLATIELRKVRTMQRIMPVRKDRRPDVYERLWAPVWRARRPG